MRMRGASTGLLAAGLTLVLSGCSGSEDPGQANPPLGNAGYDGSVLPEAGSPWAQPGWDGGFAYPEAGGGNQVDVPVGALGALPADVCGVLQKNTCMECHATPQVGGAPMPLQTADHFAAKALDGSSVAQAVLTRIQDATKPMPPKSTGKSLPPASDVAILKAWIDGGMKGVAGGTACKKPERPITEIGSDETPSWATRGWPTDPAECDYVVTLGAHQDRNPLTPTSEGFTVPNTKDTHYECFWEQVPWNDDAKYQVIAMRAKIETPQDKALVHHFVVSAVEPWNQTVAGERPAGPGDHRPCQNPNGSTMGIWAPGGIDPLTYPEDVGVLAPPKGSYLELQVHFNGGNKYPVAAKSTAKYEICVTKKLRPNTAGVFWLGFENAFAETLVGGREGRVLNTKPNKSAIGSCEAKTKGRILSIMPHMHEQGIHGKFEVIRKSGTTQMIMDDAFDFLDQKSYFRENLQVEPGDRVRTTCQYKTDVHFGFGSADEMCFFYTLAYPLEVFKAGFLEKGFVGGDLACAGGFGG